MLQKYKHWGGKDGGRKGLGSRPWLEFTAPDAMQGDSLLAL